VTSRVPRVATVALGVVAGALALLVLAVLASAALDRPSKTIESEVTIDASRETVWRILTDFDAYSRWNPLMTAAEGDARLGEHIQVDLQPPGSDAQKLSPEIMVLRPERKLRWMSRQLLPGLGDREYEVILEPLGGGRVRVVMHKRFEGILIPFTSTEREQVGLDLMAEALKKRAEEETPGTTIRTGDTWVCNAPLEDYGELPITVKSRMDNDVAQPRPAEAVILSGPDCTGDGDPRTIDLVLEIEGDGAEFGPTSSAVKVKLGAHDIQISGFANCGAAAAGVQQSAIHVMLGYRVTFADFHVGDVEAEQPTCHGTWGTLIIEERSKEDPEPEDVVCVRCTLVSDDRALYIGRSTRSGSRNSIFISKRNLFVASGAEDPVTTANIWRRPDGPRSP
jgi:hypothetical protein